MPKLSIIPLPESTSQSMQLFRTVHLGIAFMLVFSADNARSNVMVCFLVLSDHNCIFKQVNYEKITIEVSINVPIRRSYMIN